MMQKKEQKAKNTSDQEVKKKSVDDNKKGQRKLLITKLQRTKSVISQEKSQKEQVYIAMIDPGVNSVFSTYAPGLEVVFQYFCKLVPVSSMDTTLMSQAGFNKFATLFPLVPSLCTSDEAIRIYKGITKNKSTESGINSSEFREILVTIAISALRALETDTGKKLETYGELMQEMMEWIGMPKDSKKATEILKKLASRAPTLNPRDRKKNKNSLIRVISEEDN